MPRVRPAHRWPPRRCGDGRDRCAGVRAARFQHRTDMSRRFGEVGVSETGNGRRPRVRPDEAQHHAQRRRLAGAVRAEEAGHPARLDGERQIVHRGQPFVLLGQPGDDDPTVLRPDIDQLPRESAQRGGVEQASQDPSMASRSRSRLPATTRARCRPVRRGRWRPAPCGLRWTASGPSRHSASRLRDGRRRAPTSGPGRTGGTRCPTDQPPGQSSEAQIMVADTSSGTVHGVAVRPSPVRPVNSRMPSPGRALRSAHEAGRERVRGEARVARRDRHGLVERNGVDGSRRSRRSAPRRPPGCRPARTPGWSGRGARPTAASRAAAACAA